MIHHLPTTRHGESVCFSCAALSLALPSTKRSASAPALGLPARPFCGTVGGAGFTTWPRPIHTKVTGVSQHARPLCVSCLMWTALQEQPFTAYLESAISPTAVNHIGLHSPWHLYSHKRLKGIIVYDIYRCLPHLLCCHSPLKNVFLTILWVSLWQ